MVLQDCNTLLEAILTLVTVKSKLKTMNDLYMDLLNYFAFAFDLPLDPTGIWKKITMRVEKQMEMMVDQQISIQDKVLKNSEFRIQSLSKVDLCGLLMDPTKIKILKEEQVSIHQSNSQLIHENESLMQSMFLFFNGLSLIGCEYA